MASIGTPCWKAQEAPELLNIWKAIWRCCQLKIQLTPFKCFLTILSVRGSQWPFLHMESNRSSRDPGNMASIRFRAATGHNLEPGNTGIWIHAILSLDCMVLDHFTRTMAISCEKMISPLAKCLVRSNL